MAVVQIDAQSWVYTRVIYVCLDVPSVRADVDDGTLGLVVLGIYCQFHFASP